MKKQVLWFLLSLVLVDAQRYIERGFQEDHPNAISGRRNYQYQPVPIVQIVKQMNQLHEDGSYTFGYESQDGTYRVETRNPDGITRGKYGFRDEQGILHEIDYMAGKDVGYETSGSRLAVPSRPQPEYRPQYQEQRFTEVRRPPPQRAPIPVQRRPPPPPPPRDEYYDEPAPIRPRQPTRREAMANYIAGLQRWSTF